MIQSPSPNGRNGDGRFAKGNPGGPGNPQAKAVARLRSAMLEAIGPEDIAAVARQLVALAKSGNVQAAREVLDRCLGRPLEADILERLDALERQGERAPEEWP